MRDFHLRIVTPDGLVYDGEAKSLLVRTDDGDVEFLAGHTDYFAHLGIGRARIIIGDAEKFASANGGVVSISGGEVTVAATTFEFADEIDVERAVLAKEKAEEAIARSNDDKAIMLAKAKLARAVNRINVSDLIKTR